MRTILIAAAAASLMLSADSAASQQRVSLEFRAAVATPTGKLAETDLGAGAGFGGTLALRMQSHLHLYAGWDWLHFTADQSFAGSDLDFEETGYTLGLRFQHPFRDLGRLSYRVEAGGTYKHVEIENGDGEIITDSGHEPGFELGAGVVVPVGASWTITPLARFRSLSPEFSSAGTSTTGTLRYAALEFGLMRVF